MAQTVKVWLDKGFLKAKGSGELLTNLEKNNTQAIIESLPVENSIFWTRVANSKPSKGSSALTEEETQHDHILIKLELEKFATYLGSYFDEADNDDEAESLLAFVRHAKAKAQVTQVTLLIQNYRQFTKELKNTKSDAKAAENYNNLVKKKPSGKEKTASAKKLTKSDLNAVVIDLQLNESVCIRSYETGEELRDLILSYTKAVSEYVMKQEDNNLLICEQKGEKSSHPPKLNPTNKEYVGLINVWKDILECFPLVSSDQAQAIVTNYPSPLLLKKAFDNAALQSGDKAAKLLLADIQVRRGAGVLSSVRRIGPELSQKVHKFFTSTNMNELLVNNE